MKQLGIALALLFFACWFGQGSAQCACNDTACRNTAVQNNRTAQSICCNWITQPIDTNPESLNDPDGTPLGFSLLEYRGTDSNLPNQCVRVSFPTPLRNIRYVVAAVQSESTICIQRRNAGPDDEATCGSNGVFFCQSYTSGSSIELLFFCDGSGQGSCPVNDEVFYLRPNITLLDTDDEYFCDTIDRTLPSSLVLDTSNPNVNPNPVLDGENGAKCVTSLLQPVLLLVTMLALLLFH